MKRLKLALAMAILSVFTLTGFGWARYFELSWDEEVQLHDGRVIVVKLTHTYERLGTSFTRYGGRVIARDTKLTFDAGGTDGVVTQLFKGFNLMFLDQYQGVWYAVLYGDYYGRAREIPGQDWGELEGPYGQWAIRLANGKWQPTSMSNLPEVFQRPNMLMQYGPVSEHAEFDGKKVTLSDKKLVRAKHPLGYADVQLTRPTAASPKRPDSRNAATGETK